MFATEIIKSYERNEKSMFIDVVPDYIKMDLHRTAIPGYDVITVACSNMKPNDMQIHRYLTADDVAPVDDTNITSNLIRNGEFPKIVLLNDYYYASDRVKTLLDIIIDNAVTKNLNIIFVKNKYKYDRWD